MAAETKIKNLPQFLASVKEAEKSIRDLSAPFRDIAADWMRSNKPIFESSGPGRWKDLSSGKSSNGRGDGLGGYKAAKLRRWGFIYPILKASGALERSLTDPADPGALVEVKDGTRLVMGTRVTSRGVPYPKFLNDGTRKMPARPFLAIPEIAVRRWKAILQKYVVAELKVPGSGKASG